LVNIKTTLKELYDGHVIENTISNNVDAPNIKDLIRNDLITCVRYYEHRMDNFHKVFKNIEIGKTKHYFVVTKFQTNGLPHNHGLLWIENSPHFGINSNESIEIL
jgi:hypothetical protein